MSELFSLFSATQAYAYYTADVFTDRRFGGNPLAVFPQAAGLTEAQMQAIAREFNLSETTFVFPPETPTGTRRVRIFTPTSELPFAGHPTVGTAYVLAALGEVPIAGETTTVMFEEGVGMVPVTIQSRAGRPVSSELSAAQLPEFRPLDASSEALAAMLSLTAADVVPIAWTTPDGPGQPLTPQGVSCGMPFAIIPVRDVAALGRSRLRRELWEQMFAHQWTQEIYVLAPGQGDADWQVRMYAPSLGIDEDPATGAAATALGGYLGDRAPRTSGTLSWMVSQGSEMGRPSRLRVSVDRQAGAIAAIRVAGSSMLVSSGQFYL
jgi:trans-2,3-dihydro-3-hydroxyanthranilate isomerase